LESSTSSKTDPSEEQRTSNVKPRGWKNKKPACRYDLVVLGGGTAGLVSAAGAAGLGARVALIEREALGGDCLNTGCVPSKAILQSSRIAATFSRAAEYGIKVDQIPRVDFHSVMERMRRLRADISRHDSVDRFSGLGVDIFFGNAAFTGPKTVVVDGRVLHFKKAIIATGARPNIPPIAGIDKIDVLTSQNVFSLDELPRRLGVIGAGPIGCELAQAFARFGSDVYLFESSADILPREDPEAAAIVSAALQRDGVRLVASVRDLEFRAESSGVHISANLQQETLEVEVDQVLLATGRRANIEDLDLDAAQVNYESDRGIRVDDRLRTSNRSIYAAGDVCSAYQFTHAADALARIAIGNALLGLRGRASRLHIPWSTYTSPEIAQIGIHPQAAEGRGLKIDTFIQPLVEVDRCVLDGETDGFVKVYVRHHSDKIVGGTVVGKRAGELIGMLAMAMTNGIGLKKMANTIFPYPTESEVFRRLGDQYNRTRLTPGIKWLLSHWISWR